jgi:hypothetical protein
MVPSLVLTVANDGECLSCGGFSLGKTIHFGSLKFIANCFSGLSLSPSRDVLGAIVVDSAYCGSLWPRIEKDGSISSLLRGMT